MYHHHGTPFELIELTLIAVNISTEKHFTSILQGFD